MSNLLSLIFTFSDEPLWVYRRRKVLGTFKVARFKLKPSWDLEQRRASGSLLTACKVLLSCCHDHQHTFKRQHLCSHQILTGYATHLNHDHKLRELEVLQRLSSVTPVDSSNHCVRLVAQFNHPGIDEDGEYLCLVTELFWSNVQDIQATFQVGFIAVPTVKQILRHLLLGIARLYKGSLIQVWPPPTTTIV